MKFTLFALLSLFLAAAAHAYTDEVEAKHAEFSSYKPFYLIAGNPNTKIQVSVKYEPIVNVPVYFGFTQLMMWDFRKPSDPMHDLNYAPEIFYRWRMGGNSKTEWVDLGFEHESNGKDGWDTRAWNRTNLRYFKRFYMGHTFLDTSTRIWIPYGYDEMSHHLPEYRGIYEGILTLGRYLGGFMEESDISFRFWGGGPSYITPAKGGQEVTLRFKFGKVFRPAIVLQFFNGFGENQLDATHDHYSWRVGVGL